MNLSDLLLALAQNRFETARRIGLALLQDGTDDPTGVTLALHDALVHLSDFQAARKLLEAHAQASNAQTFQIKLHLAADFLKLAEEDHYRTSEEASQGFSIDEYQAKIRGLSARYLEEARQLAQTDEEKLSVETFVQKPGPIRFSIPSVFSVAEAPEVSEGGIVRGRIILRDGSPGADLEVTLGLKVNVDQADPATFISHEMHYAPVIAPLTKLTARTCSTGHFSFPQVPEGVHEFIAVTLPPEEPGIATRFLSRSIQVRKGAATDVGDLHVTEWQSAPARAIPSPHPLSFNDAEATWTKCAEWTLQNPFYYEFPRQLLLLPLPSGNGSLRVVIEPGAEEPHQVVGGQIALLTDLAPKTNKVIALYRSEASIPPATPPHPVRLLREAGSTWSLSTGVAEFRISGDQGSIETPPLLALRGPDGIWRGEGRFRLDQGVRVTGRSVTVLEEGPLLVTVEMAYTFSNGVDWSLRLTALAGEPLLLAHEKSNADASGAFEFSLREFSGGRGYLHWVAETRAYHWSTLEAKDEIVGQLPESVPWWIPPQGFGYAMTADGLKAKDYIGVFSRRRGEWIDRAFEKIAQGPIDEDGCENRELDWPFPEMVGSSISMINVHTTREGDAFFQFGFFDGERQWGLLASAFEPNDGPFKEFGRIQHAYSSPRLQEFKDWHFDVADTVPRPHVIATREELPGLRQKTHSPRFAGLWNKIRSQDVPGARDGLVFAVEGDPLAAWYKRIQFLAIAEMRSKMTLLGRDFSDTYSPVGGRDITKWAEEYDLIAASGVFSPEEERTVRAFLILMGHIYMEEDFMNWRFNGRNANFEADRTDIVSAVGLAFAGHPDAPKFINHVIDRTERSLAAYCTPGSGKWYENPACYYLHASKCRMNLVYHLAHQGMIDLESVARLKDFLRWALHLLTPPQPVPYDVMHTGDEAMFLAAPKVRKIPPIGDHAGIGRWVPEQYAFIGKLFLQSDPAFGRELIDAYFCGSADGQRLLGRMSWENDGPETLPSASHNGSQFGNLPLLFCAFEEADLPGNPVVTPVSRRLEGFGAILRNQVNTENESCLLIKQGPGGYRYHRTEGSFLLFSKGRPLVYDGGEAGETWRHSTLSFHEVHMPLSAGHVERYFDRQGFQFVQGVHPVIIEPGAPVYLSDNCRHELVAECYRRFRLATPAATRSFAWVDDEYLIIHDDLTGSRPELSHWNLQVVGAAPTRSDGNRFHFPGRFGIDLEVVLPSHTFSATKVEALPITDYLGTPDQCFTMQHLQLSQPHASHYLAALRPKRPGDPAKFEVEALGDKEGIRVSMENRDDLLWFCRDGLTWSDGTVSFTGSFGGVLRHQDRTRLLVMGQGELTTPTAGLNSDGPNAVLVVSHESIFLEAEGEGSVTVKWHGTHQTFHVTLQTPLSKQLL